ncbi:MAG: hypothetical protein ACK5SI_16875 [Planctomycetia bacterium]|jgi:hypothetical protein
MAVDTLPQPRAARRVSQARAAGAASARSNRRRFVDPTTCERDYAAEELEFMQAVERYKRASGRAFPTCSELLGVVHALGYRKPAAAL